MAYHFLFTVLLEVRSQEIVSKMIVTRVQGNRTTIFRRLRECISAETLLSRKGESMCGMGSLDSASHVPSSSVQQMEKW